MFASSGSTRETSVSTPAMGHDSAWKKAATVTIIAAMLPRSNRGLEDIASTTWYRRGIDSACRKRNCNRESSRLVFMPFFFGLPRLGADIARPRSILRPRTSYEHASYGVAFLFQVFSFIVTLGGGRFPAPRPSDHHPSLPKPQAFTELLFPGK